MTRPPETDSGPHRTGDPDAAAPGRTRVPWRARMWQLGRVAERALEGFAVRIALSIAIIVSLLPVSWAEQLDPVFLMVFGVEFLLRIIAFVYAHVHEQAPEGLAEPGRAPAVTPRRSRGGAGLLLLIDLVALSSFLPMPVGSEGARWLRLFRLTRMLLLVGYWAPLVRDLISILARRERARQLLLMAVVVGGLSFAGAVLLHHLGTAGGGQGVDFNGDGLTNRHDRTFLNLLWWAFRQIQDPGNMLASPMAFEVVIISVVLTVFGLFLVSFLIGLGTDVVHELLELSRLRPPGMRGHTVIVNIRPSTQRLLYELMRYYRKLIGGDATVFSRAWFSHLRKRGVFGPRYLIVGGSAEPPEFVRQPELSRIAYRERPAAEDEFIERADILTAQRMLLLADLRAPDPDAETIRTLLSVVERVAEFDRRENSSILGSARERVLIAEVLDESNVGAARAAVAGGGDNMRAFIVPTEKLLALFFAGVVRSPALGSLLEELLTSRGHELYTCFFDMQGLGFSLPEPPKIGRPADEALGRLWDLGRGTRPRDHRVIPIGLLVGRTAETGRRDFEVWINPDGGPDRDLGRRQMRGFAAIANNFATIRDFAASLPSRGPKANPHPGEVPDSVEIPPLVRSRARRGGRVLVCGFRPGSIYMLEELFRGSDAAEILVLIESDAAAAQVSAALAAHTELVAGGLLDQRHGRFVSADEGWDFVHPSTEATPRLRLCIADWMASRHLVKLPCGFGHVADLDAIVFVAGENRHGDPRTTTALLKLEQLCRGRPPTQRPRIVAEVYDAKLASRLEHRFRRSSNVRVYSIQQLRAFFLFQSVVVPGFDGVYSELLGSWGQSFVHMVPQSEQQGRCTFDALSIALRHDALILIAVELRDRGGGMTLCVAPTAYEVGGTFDLADLGGVWAIAPDDLAAQPDTGRETRTPDEAAQ